MQQPRAIPFGLLAALAVAFLLGLPHLGSEQLWFDEVLSWSVYANSPNLGEMTAYLASNENHPPLYYYLMAGWTKLAGDSAFVLRLPSVLFTVLTVGLLYGLARRWFGSRIALTAAWVYALSPLAIEFSREARPYALISALAVASWWVMVRFLDGERSFWIFAYALLTLAGLYTHYSYFFLVASQLLVVALLFSGRQASASEPRTRRYAFAAAWLVIVFGYAPWVSVLVTNLYQQYVYPEGLLPISQIVAPTNFILADLVFNALFFSAKWPVDALGRAAEALVVLGLLAGVAFAGRAAWRAHQAASASGAAGVLWNRMLVVLVWFLVPPMLYLFSPIAGRYSWYYYRHLLAVLPAFAIIVALALDRLWQTGRRVISPAVAGFGVVAYVLINTPQYFINDSRWDPQHQFADAVRFLERQESDGLPRDRGGRDLMVGLWYGYRILLDYYYHGPATVASIVPERRYSNQLALVANVPRLTPMEGYLLTHPHIPYRRYRLPDELATYDRIWVVSVIPTLFDLDLALAAAGFQPTLVDLPEPVGLYLFRFERLAGLCRPMAGS